jgi:flagellar FliL protein
MAKESTVAVEPESADGTEPKKKKKGKKKLLLIVLVLVVGGGGYVAIGGMKKKAVPPTAAGGVLAAKDLGPVINLDDITLNLADGHYLKIGVALQLSKSAKSGDFTNTDARTLDATISVFGTQTVPGLSAPGGRDTAKAALAKRVEGIYPGQVIGIYFTDFVMQ